MLGIFKKKKAAGYMLGAPAKGKAVNIQDVNDPTFSSGMLGQGVAVLPSEIAMVFDTLHAISMVAENGVEILVHVGLDTVNLKGQGFEAHVKAGDSVKKGDLMLTVDLDFLKAEGYDIITPVVVCNTDEYAKVEGIFEKEVMPGDDVVEITLK